jgi:hypothetical protein
MKEDVIGEAKKDIEQRLEQSQHRHPSLSVADLGMDRWLTSKITRSVPERGLRRDTPSLAVIQRSMKDIATRSVSMRQTSW